MFKPKPFAGNSDKLSEVQKAPPILWSCYQWLFGWTRKLFKEIELWIYKVSFHFVFPKRLYHLKINVQASLKEARQEKK